VNRTSTIVTQNFKHTLTRSNVLQLRLRFFSTQVNDEAGFIKHVIEKSENTPIIVDFYADWCAPCRKLTPIIEKVVSESNGSISLVKVNIDESGDIPSQMKVQVVPTVFAISKGKALFKFEGLIPEDQVKQFADKVVDEFKKTETL